DTLVLAFILTMSTGAALLLSHRMFVLFLRAIASHVGKGGLAIGCVTYVLLLLLVVGVDVAMQFMQPSTAAPPMRGQVGMPMHVIIRLCILGSTLIFFFWFAFLTSGTNAAIRSYLRHAPLSQYE